MAVKENSKTKKSADYSKLESFIADEKNNIRKLSKGDVIEGTIMDIRPGSIVVDVGYKSEGIVAGKELKSDIIDISKLKVEEKLLVYVVKPEDEEGRLVLSIRRTQQAGIWLSLIKAKEENEIVEVIVIESNNGGLICELGGNIRGFIPTSQLDPARVYAGGAREVGQDVADKVNKRLASLVGEKIKTRIIELDREKNRIILSEKMLTQTRDSDQREKTLKNLQEGSVLKGEVSGVTPYGIFVNAQGLEGLVHLSELSWDKIDNVEEMYQVSDKVEVMVIGITDGGKRVAYSVKRLQDDPWVNAISKYKVGDVVTGVVQRVADYGAFVRIGKGLNGLVHISEISDKLVKDPRDFVKEGDEVKVKILSISSTERHLGLSLKSGSKDKGEEKKKKAKVVKKKVEEKPEKESSPEELAKAVDDAIDKEISS